MSAFQVRDVSATNRLPEAWWAGVTIAAAERAETVHVLIPDRDQAEPSAEWIEARLRELAGDGGAAAVDRLIDLARPYYGVPHPVIRLPVD